MFGFGKKKKETKKAKPAPKRAGAKKSTVKKAADKKAVTRQNTAAKPQKRTVTRKTTAPRKAQKSVTVKYDDGTKHTIDLKTGRVTSVLSGKLFDDGRPRKVPHKESIYDGGYTSVKSWVKTQIENGASLARPRKKVGSNTTVKKTTAKSVARKITVPRKKPTRAAAVKPKRALGNVYWANSQKIDATDQKPRRPYAVTRDNGKSIGVSKVRGYNNNPKNEKRLAELNQKKYGLKKRCGVDRKVYTNRADTKQPLSLKEI